MPRLEAINTNLIVLPRPRMGTHIDNPLQAKRSSG